MWFNARHGDMPRVQDIIFELGGSFNASTAADWTNYMTIAPKEALPALIKLESLRITDPILNIPELIVDVEREVIRNEYRYRYENGAMVALPYLWDKLYPEGHKYARLGIGTSGSLDNVRLADIKTFTEVNYTPENTTIMIVGDLDIENNEDALALLYDNLAPEIVHPDLTEADYQKFARSGIKKEDYDSNNPEHYVILPKDQKFFPTFDLKRRVSAKSPPLTAPRDRTMSSAEALVDNRTVVIAWTVPGVYRQNEQLLQLSASVLNRQIWQFFYDDYRVVGGTSPEVGCFPNPRRDASEVICMIEITKAAEPENVANKALDQVAFLWNPDMQMQLAPTFQYGVNQTLTGILHSLDNISSLYAGRSTEVVEYAHFTGSTAYHSDMINMVTQTTPDQISEFAKTYLTRDRAAMIVLNPLPDEERMAAERKEGYHGQIINTTKLGSAIKPEDVTPELLAKAYVGPDVSKIQERVLDNGLRVVVMPHGNAPIVKVDMIYGGGRAVNVEGSMRGFDSFASLTSEEVWRQGYDPLRDPLQIAGSWSNRRGAQTTREGMTASSGNLDGVLWLIRDGIEKRRVDLSGRGSWAKSAEKSIRGEWRSESWWKDRVKWDSVTPGNALTAETYDYADIQRYKKMKKKEVKAYLNRKFQPANATLLIVGNVNPEETLALADQYFGSWYPAAGTNLSKLPGVPGPTEAKPGGIYVFDVKKNTQTQIGLTCAIEPWNESNLIAEEMLAKMLSEKANRLLRQGAGVTYGAGATAYTAVGGTSMIMMQSLVENAGIKLTVDTFYDLLREVADGEIDEARLALNKLHYAKANATSFQSVAQMSSKLLGDVIQHAGRRDWNYFENVGKQISSVTPELVTRTLANCRENAVVILEGPEDSIKAALDEGGYEYVVFDYKAAGDKLLETHDPKEYAKMMSKRAKSEAKKAKEKAKEAAESGDDAPTEEATTEESPATEETAQ
jgi:zinc protease